ncbi:pilus assembly PilX N-terminal domain-containing protein [Kurthia zopfii]|uniref:pilus assembly PilX N-terminal domain-containing protein n=1 Tax=Kurthia zopfii TaxID=1650 RepID=UPI000F7064E6|nr:PilX N-terminal domain-containing pilus assembly protein [Kurthia zopfii]VEI07934.1 Tfp pilus assembly protein PilX [Kurthia zopfii]
MKKLKNEQGYALAIAVLVITILSILGISLMTTTGNSKKMANKEQENQAAYYIAEAGLNLKKAEIKKAADQFRKETAGWKDSKLEEALKQPPKISTSTTYNSKNSNGTNKVFDTNNASAKVTVEYTTKSGVKTTTDNQTKAVQNYIYKIKSVGTIDNQKRTITSTMSYDLTVNSEEQAKPDEEIEGYYPIEGIPEASIHALESFSFHQDSLKGKLLFGFDKSVTNSIFPFAKESGGGKYFYTNNNFVNHGGCKNKTCLGLGNNMEFNKPDQVKLYPFPTKEFKLLNQPFPSQAKEIEINNSNNATSISSGTYTVSNKNFSNGKKLYLDIGKNDVILIMKDVTDFSYSSNPITILGSGKITIYTDNFEMKEYRKSDFHNNDVTIVSTNKFSITGSSSIKLNSLKLIAKNFYSEGNTEITSTSKSNFFISNSFTLNVNLKGPIGNIFYSGVENIIVSDTGAFSMNFNIDSLNGSLSNFNTKGLTGNILLRNKFPKKPIEFTGTPSTLNGIFIYAPAYSVVFNSNKPFAGVLVAKNINIVQGQVEYAEPNIPTTKPPTNGNDGNNGSNNGDSIITNSTFSDALDSGTLEIDNER